MKKLFLMIVITIGLSGICFAQRQIMGSVTDEAGQALIGANVIVKGTTKGVVTDIQGKYKLDAPQEGAVLVFSYVGYATQEIVIQTADVIDVLLVESVYLDEAVITALGIERSEKSLSYAVQEIGQKELNIVRQSSVNNALAGKVAGMQVLSESGIRLGFNGGIRIRGVGSLTGPGSPLYVVDGTPTRQIPSMDDIESISVLKGPNATALYGQRGDQGVIAITTKKAVKRTGIGIEVNQSSFMDKLYLLPKYQNSYAGGIVNELIPFEWKEGMPKEWQVFEGKFYHDYSDDTSWGPKMEGQEYIPWYAWYVGTEHFGETAKLEPQPNNIRDFYNTGLSLYNNINFQSLGEEYALRVSFTNQHIKGLIPHSRQEKYTLATSLSFNLGSHLKLGANINYDTDQINGNFTEFWPSNSTNANFNQWFHRHLDMKMLRKLRNMRSPEGIMGSWNHSNPDAFFRGARDFYAANFSLNPYAQLDNREDINNEQALNGNVNLSYIFSDDFRITAFVRRDQRNSAWESKTYNILEQSVIQSGIRNAYFTGTSSNNEDNYELLATFRKKLGKNFNFEANAGGNIRVDKYKSLNGFTSQGLNVPDLFTIANSKRKTSPSEWRSLKKVRSLYARGSFGFKDMLYLDWSGRNDWSSALPENKNSYFYPSVGLSLIFSELTQGFLPFLSYGKLRSSWAQVGSDLGPYQLDLNYFVSSRQWGRNFLMSTPNTIIDAEIEPALSSAYEFGMDLKFWLNRLGLSVTHYNESKINEILGVAITSTSGFSNMLINAGQIDRWGWELQLTAVPIKSQNVNWNVIANWGKTKNKIVELTEGVDSEVFGNEFFARVNEAGGAWGQLRGGGIKRDESGRPILTSNGLYTTETDTDLGNEVPDFNGGLINVITFKNWELAFSIDFSKGGKYASNTELTGVFSGLLERTAATNDKGMNVRDPVSDGGGVKVAGVDSEGNPTTIYVNAFDYYQQFTFRRIIEPFIYDRSFVKIREVSLSYQIPVKKLGLDNHIQGASIALVARNPWLIYTPNRNFDPSEGTVWRWESAQFPSTRSFGFNLKLNF